LGNNNEKKAVFLLKRVDCTCVKIDLEQKLDNSTTDIYSLQIIPFEKVQIASSLQCQKEAMFFGLHL